MWWPKNEGIVDEERGPTLYPKLIVGKSQAQKRYDTKFRVVSNLLDQDDVGVDINKEEHCNVEHCNVIAVIKIDSIYVGGGNIEHCNVIAVIKIDSIYVGGGNISLQVKVSEALVEIQKSKVGSFLRPVSIKAHTEIAKMI